MNSPNNNSHNEELVPVEARVIDLPAPNFLPDYTSPTPEQNSFRVYLRILQKRKKTILASLLVVLTLTTIATFRMTPLYEAVAQISISMQSEDNLRLNENQADVNTWNYAMELDTQARILQSDSLALQVIHDLNLESNPNFAPMPRDKNKPDPALPAGTAREADLMKFWQEHLSVAKVPRTRMIEIRFLSADPKLAAQIVNTLASTYVERNFKARYESTMQASDWLSKQLADLQLKVESSQEALVRYQRENGILGIDEKHNTTTDKLEDLNKELTSAESDRIQKQAAYELAAAGDLDAIPGLSQNVLIQRLREQEADLQKQLAEATTKFGASYPKVIELNTQAQNVQTSIRSELKKIAARMGTEYRSALGRERMLRTAFENQKREANLLNEKAVAYTQLKREADGNRALYESLQQKLKEATVTSGLRSSNVRMVDQARVPSSPAKPNIPRNIALGFLAGLLGGVVLAFVLEGIDNTIRTPGQLEQATALPALGIIPLSRELAAKPTSIVTRMALTRRNGAGERVSTLGRIAHVRPKSEITESYRALRTSILLSAIDSAPKVLMLTSALPQEGKTTTSSNLAIVLAQKGGRVLLVDADMRRPSAHKQFVLRNRAGLSTLLTGSSTVEESIVHAPGISNLFILPAGPPPPFPAELIGSAVMKGWLDRWRLEYDHIVIDSPPILSVTDAVLLSAEADAVLLVVRSGKTAKEALRRSREVLQQVNARVLGAVVNGIDLRSPDSYYYYYGSNYGGSYYDETARKK